MPQNLNTNLTSTPYEPLRVIVAMDSLKGCMTSAEANLAAAQGIRDAFPSAEVTTVAVSDGGEGFAEAFQAAAGGDLIEVTVRDALLRPAVAHYVLKGNVAVIETAQAIGLALLAPEERNPLVATSYGAGLLVADAVRRGATHVITGLGGSATSDAGIGMLRALIDTFAPGGSWADVRQLSSVRFTIASDVRNPLCGENGAARVFAPQKGATLDMVERLEARARRFAELSARHFGHDRSCEEGAGAAGGLGYSFLQYLGAECRPGAGLLLEAAGFDALARRATAIITGEGAADRQTLMGKLPMGIFSHSHGTPVHLIAGKVSDREQLLGAGFATVACFNPDGLPLQEAMRKDVAARNIASAAAKAVLRSQEGGCLTRQPRAFCWGEMRRQLTK